MSDQQDLLPVAKADAPLMPVQQSTVTDYMPQLIELSQSPNFNIEAFESMVAFAREQQAMQAKQAWTRAFTALTHDLASDPVVKKSVRELTDKGAMTAWANVTDIRSHVDPYLRKHGLALVYGMDTVDGKEYQTCRVVHRDGHEGPPARFPYSPDRSTKVMNDLQARGSGQTYAMRYATTEALGLWYVDKDDDGVAAGRKPFQPQVDTITEQQERDLNDAILAWCDAKGKPVPSVLARMNTAYGISRLRDLPADRFEDAMGKLK